MLIAKPSLSLLGFQQSMIYAYQEALIACNQHLIHALEVAGNDWARKMAYDCDTDPRTAYVDTVDLDGWVLQHLTNGKSLLTPLNVGPRKDEVKDIVCFFKMRGTWHPVLMRAQAPFGQNRYMAGQLFAFIHTICNDMHCSNQQAFYETAFLDSAEVVLAVEPEVIDWILADNKKES